MWHCVKMSLGFVIIGYGKTHSHRSDCLEGGRLYSQIPGNGKQSAPCRPPGEGPGPVMRQNGEGRARPRAFLEFSQEEMGEAG